MIFGPSGSILSTLGHFLEGWWIRLRSAKNDTLLHDIVSGGGGDDGGDGVPVRAQGQGKCNAPASIAADEDEFRL